LRSGGWALSNSVSTSRHNKPLDDPNDSPNGDPNDDPNGDPNKYIYTITGISIKLS